MNEYASFELVLWLLLVVETVGLISHLIVAVRNYRVDRCTIRTLERTNESLDRECRFLRAENERVNEAYSLQKDMNKLLLKNAKPKTEAKESEG